MSKRVFSNEIIADICFDVIDKDFNFFRIKTSEKYIKGGAAFLDIEDSVVSSIVYEYGNAFYIMTKKNAVSRSELIKMLASYDGGEKLSLEVLRSKSIEQYLLLQMFFNSISNPTDELCSYNNLSGKLLCYKPGWIDRDENGVIWGMNCLEIKLCKDMCIKMTAHKMTPIMLKNKMTFGTRQLHDYPQYEFSYNNHTLKRVSKEHLNEKTNMIQKPVEGGRGAATFFDFKDYDAFSCTKNGILYDIINIVKENYSDYFNLHFKVYEVDECLEYKRKNLEKYKTIVNNLICTNCINLIDDVKSLTSADYLLDVEMAIKKILPDVKVYQGKRLSKNKFNIRYIHTKDFYSENDPHQDDMSDYMVQHITVENFNCKAEAAVYNILKELAVKYDLKIGRITLVDWTEYEYCNDWIFGMVSDSKYYFMIVHPDGTFEINQLERTFFTITEYDTYMDYFESDKNVVGLIKDSDGNINLIRDTNKYSIPDFIELGNILLKESENVLFSGSDVIDMLKAVINCTEDKNIRNNILAGISNIDILNKYSKKEVIKMIPGTKAKKAVVGNVYNNTGILLYTFLRGEKERNDYLSGNIDINYIKIDDFTALYSIGEIGDGMNYNIERSSILREIHAVSGSRLIFNQILPLMGVEFVRYGMLTVFPFPFKYLREYIYKASKQSEI